MKNNNRTFASDEAIRTIDTILEEHKKIRLSILDKKIKDKDKKFYRTLYNVIETLFKYNKHLGDNVDSEMKSSLYGYPWERPYFGRFDLRQLAYTTQIKNIDHNNLDYYKREFNGHFEYKPRTPKNKKIRRDNINKVLEDFARFVKVHTDHFFVELYFKKLTSGSFSKQGFYDKEENDISNLIPSIKCLDIFLDDLDKILEEEPDFDERGFTAYLGQYQIKKLIEGPCKPRHKFIDPLLNYVGRKAGDDEAEIITHTKEKTGQEEKSTNISSIRFGSEIEQILKHQLAAKRNPKLNKLFKLAFVERKLLELEYQTKKVFSEQEHHEIVKEECELEGNFILCLDTSLSMSDDQMSIIKTIACAMTLEAIQKKRKCYIIEFSSSNSEFDAANPDCINDFLNFIEEADRGGTNIEGAILRGLEILKEENFALSDILIVSDFEIYPLTDKTIDDVKKQREKGNRIFGLRLIENNIRKLQEQLQENIYQWTDQFWTYCSREQNDDQIANDINSLINKEKHKKVVK